MRIKIREMKRIIIAVIPRYIYCQIHVIPIKSFTINPNRSLTPTCWIKIDYDFVVIRNFLPSKFVVR